MDSSSNRWSDEDVANRSSMRSRTWSSMRSRETIALDEVESPFPALEVDLSLNDLRETAYEVLVCSTLLGSSEAAAGASNESRSPGSPHSPAHAAVRRLKKALVRRRTKRKNGELHHSRDLDIARSQMEISERRDGRIRKALSRAAEAHVAIRPDCLLVPVELLLHLSSSDFLNSQEYQHWLSRQLKVVEAGMLVYPASLHENSELFAGQLRKALAEVRDRPARGGKLKELLQALRAAVVGLAGEGSHWADGYPFNIYLYDMLLRSLFDSLEEGSFIFEIDQVLDLVKKTWSILGITDFLHHVCFLWVLFRQFMITGQTEAELLRVAEIELREAKACRSAEATLHSDLLSSVLTSIQGWSEVRLLSYHEYFGKTEIRAMEGLVSVSVLADEVLNEHVLHESKEINTHTARARIHEYIQASVSCCFSQMFKELFEEQGKVNAALLANLAKSVVQLALDEEECFSPKFKLWHPFPARLAAATLQTAYMRELQHYLEKNEEPMKDVMQALESAAMLEKKLMRMSVENDLNAGEFTPTSFAADPLVHRLLRDWLQENLQQLSEWVQRNVEQEEWSSDALREHYAISGVEVLRMVEDMLDAFFALPVYEDPGFVQGLIFGVDFVLKSYASLSVHGCDAEETRFDFDEKFLANLKAASVLNRVGDLLKKRSDMVALYRNKVWPQLNDADADADGSQDSGKTVVEKLCVRLNTLYYIQTQMEFLEKKIRYGWQELVQSQNLEVRFTEARSCCQAGIDKLYEYIAYKLVYCNVCKRHWESLYSNKEKRMNLVTDYLNTQLLVVANTSSDWLRDKLVKHLMKACFEAFIQVVSYRSSRQTAEPAAIQVFEEDFTVLQDLFKAEGDGLSDETVDRTSEPVVAFVKSLPLLKKQDEEGEEEAQQQQQQHFGSSGSKGIDFETNLKMIFTKPKSPPVPQSLQHLTNTNVFATMVGYRCHSMASKFVKKSFDFSRS